MHPQQQQQQQPIVTVPIARNKEQQNKTLTMMLTEKTKGEMKGYYRYDILYGAGGARARETEAPSTHRESVASIALRVVLTVVMLCK